MPRRRVGRARFLIPDKDGKFPALFDAVLADTGIRIVRKRWVQPCRHELLDRTLICNQRHLLHALRQYELFYNAHRPHQANANARPLRPLPSPISDPEQIARLDIHRHQRLGGTLNEYQHAA